MFGCLVHVCSELCLCRAIFCVDMDDCNGLFLHAELGCKCGFELVIGWCRSCEDYVSCKFCSEEVGVFVFFSNGEFHLGHLCCVFAVNCYADALGDF